MKKIGLGILMGIVILSLSGIVGAGKLIPVANQAQEKAKADNSPVIEKVDDYLISAAPERVVFIHYKKGYGGFCDNDGICEKDLGENPSCADCKKDKEEPEEPATACYAFLGKWVKWREFPVNYVIDPDNPDGLTEKFVIGAMSAGAEEWNSHTSENLFGSYIVDYNSSWDSDTPDGRNEMLFGDYPRDGVIAVAIIWGYFTGPPSSRKILEFDILFDTDFTWGDAVINPEVMDLQNIATHEIGHGAGLADLYETACLDETMYGYSDYGEVKKRDLNVGDIIGIQELYSGF